jgi:hypothetical protein
VRRILISLTLLLGLAACAAPEAPFADDETVARYSYKDNRPRALTLFTVVNNRTGAGAHTGLLINASERVLFDPAGSFYYERAPERNDLLYGISPAVEKAYVGAHARSTYHVVIQTIEVDAQQAETAFALARAKGAAAPAYCANATSSVLQKVPGFEEIETTFYPNELMKQFAKFPGVKTSIYREDDSPDLDKALAQLNAD